MERWTVASHAADETRRLGGLLGTCAPAGLVVLLSGELGAGKTCFAQGVARGLDVPAATPVTSPSYALMHIYRGRLPLHHFDLYRLSRIEDLDDLGYDDWAGQAGVTLVEWADRLDAPLPASLAVTIHRDSETRRDIDFVALDEAGKALLATLCRAWTEGHGAPAPIPRAVP